MRPVYQLNPTRLLPGDVILERGDSLYSKVIRLSDRGRFSHVILYLGANFIVEAVEEGVRIMQALRVITDDPRGYAVLRHPEIEKLRCRTSEITSFVEQKLFASLLSELNKPYSWRGILGTKLPFFRKRTHEHFCSQLVAEGFKRIGFPLCATGVPADRITPKFFETDACVLRRVEGCFVQLPDSEWLRPFDKDRFKVLKSSTLPILELGSQIARDAVKVFGPRIDAAAQKINRQEAIGSLQDLYRLLYIPDLPDGDEIADDLTTWMELRYPSRSIREHAAATRRSFEHIASGGNRELLPVAIKTLQVDIDCIQRVLPVLERRLRPVDRMPAPSKVRSIHLWVEKKFEESVAFERELLAWRMAFLEKFETTDTLRTPGE